MAGRGGTGKTNSKGTTMSDSNNVQQTKKPANASMAEVARYLAEIARLPAPGAAG